MLQRGTELLGVYLRVGKKSTDKSGDGFRASNVGVSCSRIDNYHICIRVAHYRVEQLAKGLLMRIAFGGVIAIENALVVVVGLKNLALQSEEPPTEVRGSVRELDV